MPGDITQVVIALAEKYMRSADPRFPVGRTRLETVGVVACAIIMTIATIEVIQSAAEDLIAGFFKGWHFSFDCPLPRACNTTYYFGQVYLMQPLAVGVAIRHACTDVGLVLSSVQT